MPRTHHDQPTLTGGLLFFASAALRLSVFSCGARRLDGLRPRKAPVAPQRREASPLGRGPCPGSGLSLDLGRGSVPPPNPYRYLRPPLPRASLGGFPACPTLPPLSGLSPHAAFLLPQPPANAPLCGGLPGPELLTLSVQPPPIIPSPAVP